MCVLKGRVRDARTGEPLVGASVVVNGTEHGNATDLKGNYIIVGLPAMTGMATAAHAGYDDTSASFTTTTACTTRLDFSLQYPLVQPTAVRPPSWPARLPPKSTPLPARPRPIALPLPVRSDSRLCKYWGNEMSVLAVRQMGDSVLIQTIGPRAIDLPAWNGPSIKEGKVPIVQFRTFWDSLGQLGFWQFNNAYRAPASRGDATGGYVTVSFEVPGRAQTTKTVRFFAPGSCSLEFRQVYTLFDSLARFAQMAPDWRTLLRYEDDAPIEGLEDLYHAEVLQTIAVNRDTQGLDMLLSMLRRNDEYAPAVIRALANIGSRRAVPALEAFLAVQIAEADSPATQSRETLALAAAKVLVGLDGRRSVPAIRQYLDVSYHRSRIGDWCVLLAGVGDYSLVPEVLQILGDTTRHRYDRAKEAAGILERAGYRSQYVISMLLQIAETELEKDRPENGTVAAMMSALRALTGQEFSDHHGDSLAVRRTNMRKWLRWWAANAETFPAGNEGGSPGGYGLIQVSSTPSGAAISLDGAASGNATPFVLLNVPVGRHQLRLTRESHADWSLSVTVTQGRATTVDATMLPIFGSLRVNSSPSGASISLDGTNTEEVAPHLFVTVATGKHRVRLTKKGHVNWDSTVSVIRGQTATASAKLRPAPDSMWITYANPQATSWLTWGKPERAVRFNTRTGFGFPLQIAKVSAVFYLSSNLPWPDSSFRFKIYGGNGQTLLYQSPVLEAAPGQPGPAVVHELSVPVLADSGEFYVSVAPVDTSGKPTSLTWSKHGDPQVPLGASEDTANRCSYAGSPGHWTSDLKGELALAVLVRRFGSIQVNSTPSGAAISLDSISTGGTTPSLVSGATSGEHDLWLTRDGCADWRSRVTVVRGRTTTVDAALSQSFGSLQVSSVPSGAAISLDGAGTGKTTPCLFTNLAVGGHRLQLSGIKHLEWDSTVTVDDGRTSDIVVQARVPPESVWATYAKTGDMAWSAWAGPERAIRLDPRDFGFGYPLYIRKVNAAFYSDGGHWWPDSSFRFKIYGDDGQTLLYQSPVLEAVPGQPGPPVVHELSAPVLLDSGEFYLSVAPVDESGQPSSGGTSRSSEEGKADGIPASAPYGHSYVGSPGRWSQYTHVEFSYSVLLTNR